MTRLIFWRLVQMPLLLLIIYTVTFVLAWQIPGNPFQGTDARKPPKEVEQAMNAQYNLDDPTKFYWQYLGNAIQGDFGPALFYKDWRVSEIIRSSFPVSLQLGLMALFIALVLGMITGALSAIKRGGVMDFTTLLIALIGISIPTFVTGTVLLMFFGLVLRWLPVGGWGSISQIIMPAFTLSLPFAAYIARLMRLGMIDIMSSDYIRTARAKGLSERQVVTRHAMKVAFLPVLSFLGPAAAGAMTGSFVVEKVFNVPGMGQHFVTAVQNKDLMLIMGVVLLFAVLLIVFNLIVDVAYGFVDPRIQYD